MAVRLMGCRFIRRPSDLKYVVLVTPLLVNIITVASQRTLSDGGHKGHLFLLMSTQCNYKQCSESEEALIATYVGWINFFKWQIVSSILCVVLLRL